MLSRNDQKAGAERSVDEVSNEVERLGTRRRRRMRLPGCWSAARRSGKVAAALSSSTSPAWMPPTRGSTRRSTTGRPRRRPDDLADRAVAGDAPGAAVRGHQVACHPQRLRGAEYPRTRERPPLGRHSEGRTFGHRTQPSPCPDRRTGRADRHQLVGDAELFAQLGRLGSPREERIAGEIDGPAGELVRAELPPDSWRRVDEHDRRRAVRSRLSHQLPRGREAGDTRADDDEGRAGGRAHRRSAAARTTPARAARNRGSSLSDSVRANAMPASLATPAASTSRS